MTEPRWSESVRSPDPSTRLNAALAAGTNPDCERVGTLVGLCAVEPDFSSATC